MNKIAKLTDLEIKIMKVLWEHEQCLTIQIISQYLQEENISAASVSQAMKRLIAKKAVTVDEHVLVSSVYARAFVPCFSQEDFLMAEFERIQKKVLGKKRPLVATVMTLLDESDDDNITLEDMKKIRQIISHKIRDREV